MIKIGREYFEENNAREIELYDQEAMKRYGAKIIKPILGIKEYKKMCVYFFLKNMIDFFNINKKITFGDLLNKIKNLYKTKLYINWWNIGGQIVPEDELNNLIRDIKENKLQNWESIHKRYDLLWAKYPEQKARYSLYTLEQVLNKKINEMQNKEWKNIFEDGITIIQNILSLSISSREKDFTDPFRKMVYRNNNEMKAVLENIEKNPFLNYLKKQTKDLIDVLKSILNTM